MSHNSIVVYSFCCSRCSSFDHWECFQSAWCIHVNVSNSNTLQQESCFILLYRIGLLPEKKSTMFHSSTLLPNSDNIYLLCSFAFSRCHINEIIYKIAFSDWLFFFNWNLRFKIYPCIFVAGEFIPFFMLFPSYECTTVCLSTHRLKDILRASSLRQLWINLL